MIKATNRITKKFVEIVASVTPHCHDITRLLSQSMEHPLPLRTRLLIRLHFTICVWCGGMANSLSFCEDTAPASPKTGVKAVPKAYLQTRARASNRCSKRAILK